MTRTNVEVLLQDTRIKEYLCQWAPLTKHTHIEGLHRPIQVAFFADAPFAGEFRTEFPLANRFSEKHFLYAERVIGNVTLILLRVYGRCPICTGCEFDILPNDDAEQVELILCRSCGARMPKDSEYEWNSMGGPISEWECHH